MHRSRENPLPGIRPCASLIIRIQALESFNPVKFYPVFSDNKGDTSTLKQKAMRDPQLQYQRQSVMNASPVKLVVKLYDLAIQATWREDDNKVREILSTLIKGLNFDHEPAEQLYNIYRYCQDISREGRFEEIREVLEPIREAWENSATEAIVRNANGSTTG